jgi:putative nucleic acid binding protein
MCCWPVGLLVMWTSPKTSIVTKAVATCIFGGLGLLFLVGMVAGAKKHDAPPAVTPAAETALQATRQVAIPAVPPTPLYANSAALLSRNAGKNAFCFLLESDRDLSDRVKSMQKTSKSKLTTEKACPAEGVLGYCVNQQPDKKVTATGYDVSSTEALKKDCADWHETEAFAEAVRNRPVSVTAAQLYDAYQDNEVQADMQYKDKRLLVSGRVDKVSKDVMDKPFVSLSTSNMFMSILAYDMPENAVATLRKGTALTLLCRGQGMTIGSPILRDCSIE